MTNSIVTNVVAMLVSVSLQTNHMENYNSNARFKTNTIVVQEITRFEWPYKGGKTTSFTIKDLYTTNIVYQLVENWVVLTNR